MSNAFGDDDDLFGRERAQRLDRRRPLAERMRPRTLDEYIGQDHLLAPGRLLRRAIEADRVSSLILYGPPGTGKTTLAQVIAYHSNATFRPLNAVLSGVKILRQEVEEAQRRLQRFEQRTLLFIDEIHRFNQAQQDALLPWVERGVITLIGATTENPYFEVNAALNSRSHIFQLRLLNEEELTLVARRALDDPRGYAERSVDLSSEALSHWATLVNGDARAILNALELAVETTSPTPDSGLIHIDLSIAEASIQERAVLYDRSGDLHFDTMSAYIKSMRGSDADAALYWLARMVYAGEAPRAIFRRLLIFASEDVGLAWPEGIVVVNACASAFDRVGLPEGRFHLSQATLAMATAPKSNSTLGFFDAIKSVEGEVVQEVPSHLKDPHRDGETLRHGAGYLYPHAYQHHWVAQDYLPEGIRGQRFYQPSDQGSEAEIGQRVMALREAQLEGVLSSSADHPLVEMVSPHSDQVEKWTDRAMGDATQEWSQIREAVIERADLKRDDLILDLNAGAGLFTWPATRTAIEGGVFTWCESPREAEVLSAQASALPWAHRPTIDCGRLDDQLAPLFAWPALQGVTLTCILSRGLMRRSDQWERRGAVISHHLAQGQGRWVSCEPLPRDAQRLSALFTSAQLPSPLSNRWRSAEEEIYERRGDPILWSCAELEGTLQGLGFADVNTQTLQYQRRLSISEERIKRWVSEVEGSYFSRLSSVGLKPEELEEIATALFSLRGARLSWHISRVIFSCSMKGEQP